MTNVISPASSPDDPLQKTVHEYFYVDEDEDLLHAELNANDILRNTIFFHHHFPFELYHPDFAEELKQTLKYLISVQVKTRNNIRRDRK